MNKKLFGMCWVMFDENTRQLNKVIIKPYIHSENNDINLVGNNPEEVRKLMNQYMSKHNLFSNTIYNDLNKNKNKTYLGNRHCLRFKKEEKI